ncbi:hypothetical protein SAMN04488542_101111 [Fontibacillus panacisegetis]|uniref:Uncharacterized protein n=1 Tax=Fontibacillus panacisegetis TaxID=670482 RepID=A0A1G7E9D9_9BACL|nr:hypothetical protein [Fontibacillus panacisegetis]SDE60308.1 hypothetical protein SAMN04488542_101111 [Fontibacillus panacisegetis]
MLPLEYTNPELYSILRQELAPYHLHSFDVQACGAACNEGFTVVLKYGDNLSYTKEKSFSQHMMKENIEDIRKFFRSAGDDIKKALISDYFKMMKNE